MAPGAAAAAAAATSTAAAAAATGGSSVASEEGSAWWRGGALAGLEGVEAALSCGICNLVFDDRPLTAPCGHTFCSECIHKWLRDHPDICPGCRSESKTSASEFRLNEPLKRAAAALRRARPGLVATAAAAAAAGLAKPAAAAQQEAAPDSAAPGAGLVPPKMPEVAYNLLSKSNFELVMVKIGFNKMQVEQWSKAELELLHKSFRAEFNSDVVAGKQPKSAKALRLSALERLRRINEDKANPGLADNKHFEKLQASAPEQRRALVAAVLGRQPIMRALVAKTKALAELRHRGIVVLIEERGQAGPAAAAADDGSAGSAAATAQQQQAGPAAQQQRAPELRNLTFAEWQDGARSGLFARLAAAARAVEGARPARLARRSSEAATQTAHDEGVVEVWSDKLQCFLMLDTASNEVRLAPPGSPEARASSSSKSSSSCSSAGAGAGTSNCEEASTVEHAGRTEHASTDEEATQRAPRTQGEQNQSQGEQSQGESSLCSQGSAATRGARRLRRAAAAAAALKEDAAAAQPPRLPKAPAPSPRGQAKARTVIEVASEDEDAAKGARENEGATQTQGGRWACGQCTLVNGADEPACTACDKRRPEPAEGGGTRRDWWRAPAARAKAPVTKRAAKAQTAAKAPAGKRTKR
jgi:hypothetical protein